jgi:hypothetical protein
MSVTAKNKIPKFVELIPMWTNDYRHSKQIPAGWHNSSVQQGLWQDVARRFRQLDWTLDHVAETEQKMLPLLELNIERDQEILNAINGRIDYAMDHSLMTLDYFVEAFYLFSWQMIGALRPMPGFGKKFNVLGIGEMRNWIISAHSIDQAKSTFYGTGFSGSEDYAGPTLKSNVKTPSGWSDPGIYENARELREKFEDRVRLFCQ